jgi:pSer/pThr/pTyr-binding forkhead associated (FHA) protein
VTTPTQTDSDSLPTAQQQYRLTVEDESGRLIFDRALPPNGLTIGRLAPCEVLLKGTPVSRQHARVAVDLEGAFISDLGSANGTFVDGNRIEGDKGLDDRSLIEIGGYRLRVMQLREIRDSGSFSIFVPPAADLQAAQDDYGLLDSDAAFDSIRSTVSTKRGASRSGGFRTELVGYLLITDRLGTNEALILDSDTLTLGRDPSNDLILDRVGVTRFHARLTRQDMRWTISDTGIPGSVLVDGVAVRQHVLREGEVVVLGNTPVIYTASDRPAVRAELLQRSAAGGTEVDLQRREQKGLVAMLLVLAMLGLAATISFALFRLDDPTSEAAFQVRGARDQVSSLSSRFDAQPAARAQALASAGDWSASLAAYDEAIRRAPNDTALAAERAIVRSRAASEQAVASCETIFKTGVDRYVASKNQEAALAEMTRAEDCLKETATEPSTRARSETLLNGTVYPSLFGVRLALGDRYAAAADCAKAAEAYHLARTVALTIARSTGATSSTLADKPLMEQASLCGDEAFESSRWSDAIAYYITASDVGPLGSARATRLATARQSAGAATP